MPVLVTFFLHTLAVIVEVRLATEQRVLQLLFFFPQLLHSFRLLIPPCLKRARSRGGRFARSLFRFHTLPAARRYKRLRVLSLVLILMRCQDSILPLGFQKKTAP